MRLHHALAPPGAIEEAGEMLELARQIAEARGARFALLFLPHPDECVSGSYRVDLSSFRFPDLRPYFPRDAAGVARIHFPDDRHWNARRHRMAARAVVHGLLALEVLTPEDVHPARRAERIGSPRTPLPDSSQESVQDSAR
jgi:hypothetical protein